MMTNYNNIPQELQHLNQWVACTGKTKIPLNVITMKGASSSDASSWHSYREAVDAVNWGLFDYAGFVFADNGYVGIDIDKGLEDGYITDLAVDIISRCESYTEKSKSGRGFHIILKGDLPFDGKNNFEGVEIYKSKRFFVMTGNTFVYDTIQANQDAIDYVVDKYFNSRIMDCGKQNTGTGAIYKPIYKKGSLFPEYPPIVQGGRNLSLLSYGGSLRSAGYDDNNLLQELRKVNNKACQPPLDDKEVISVWHSVIKYKRG